MSTSRSNRVLATMRFDYETGGWFNLLSCVRTYIQKIKDGYASDFGTSEEVDFALRVLYRLRSQLILSNLLDNLNDDYSVASQAPQFYTSFWRDARVMTWTESYTAEQINYALPYIEANAREEARRYPRLTDELDGYSV